MLKDLRPPHGRPFSFPFRSQAASVQSFDRAEGAALHGGLVGLEYHGLRFDEKVLSPPVVLHGEVVDVEDDPIGPTLDELLGVHAEAAGVVAAVAPELRGLGAIPFEADGGIGGVVLVAPPGADHGVVGRFIVSEIPDFVGARRRFASNQVTPGSEGAHLRAGAGVGPGPRNLGRRAQAAQGEKNHDHCNTHSSLPGDWCLQTIAKTMQSERPGKGKVIAVEARANSSETPTCTVPNSIPTDSKTLEIARTRWDLMGKPNLHNSLQTNRTPCATVDFGSSSQTRKHSSSP